MGIFTEITVPEVISGDFLDLRNTLDARRFRHAWENIWGMLGELEILGEICKCLENWKYMRKYLGKCLSVWRTGARLQYDNTCYTQPLCNTWDKVSTSRLRRRAILHFYHNYVSVALTVLVCSIIGIYRWLVWGACSSPIELTPTAGRAKGFQ